LKFRSFIVAALILAAASQASANLTQWLGQSPREVQQALSDRGFDPGPVDGRWGKKSINALKAFQKANGLANTGIVDDASTMKLFPGAEPALSPTTTEIEKVSPPIVDVPFVDAQPADEPATKAGRVAVSPPPVRDTVVQHPVSDVLAPEVLRDTGSNVAEPEPGGGGLYTAAALFGAGILLMVYRRRRRKRGALSTIVTSGPTLNVPTAAIPASIPTARSVHIEPPMIVPDFRVSLAAHNQNVAEFISGRGQDASPDNVGVLSFSVIETVLSDMDKDPLEVDYLPTAPPMVSAELFAVEPIKPGEFVKDGKPLFGNALRTDGSGPLSQLRHLRSAFETLKPNQTGWVPAGTSVTVGGVTFEGGLVYVGGYLPKQGAPQENENCLINPKLLVSKTGDPNGNTMGYWPSYSQITPQARKSYLDWLSGPRRDPAAYIGFVFMYFYGLERRLMLEENAPDADEVLSEVARLAEVYGGNNSFNRYAHELLSAYELKAKPLSADYIPDVEGNGYEVPTSIKLALGVRVKDGKPIEPDLLMKFAMSHPETRVRTPARRAPELLRYLFIEEMNARHPGGFQVRAGRYKTLKASYRACSGSFTIEVAALGGSVPDITDRAEPIGTARTVFEACSDKLDDYSRVLGRSPGLQPTLNAVARLPRGLRFKAAESLPGNPVARIEVLASEGRPVGVKDLAAILAIDAGNVLGKTKLRDMSQLLGSFGYGNTADPMYAMRLASMDDPVILFPLLDVTEQISEPSPSYRSLQLSVMLGMVIGYADGHLDDAERKSLDDRINSAPGISAAERLRLRAEVAINDLDSARLDEWSKRLKDVPVSAREDLASELVAIAAADGTLHASEIKKLEVLFKRMCLEPQSLYRLLHESNNARRDDDDMSFVIEAGEEPIAVPIPREPTKSSATRIDLGRLNAIRSETRITASVLADIFVEEEQGVESIVVPEPAAVDEGGVFDGLERRYGFLVTELSTQASWSSADFESLVRGAGLMPGAAREAINDWALDRFDELFIEDDDPVVINSYLLPTAFLHTSNSSESISA